MSRADLAKAAVIEFELRTRPGRVVVRFGKNDDPARWGYPFLGLESPPEMARGFPVVHAEVEYAAEGYAAIFGWIQIVRGHNLDTDERMTVVDRAPQLAELDLPYVTFGVRPTFFDAPATDEAQNLDFHAQTTLVASPDCLMTRHVEPLCGFSWGYELRDGRPIAVWPQEIDGSAWHEDRRFLREQHLSWTFEPRETTS